MASGPGGGEEEEEGVRGEGMGCGGKERGGVEVEGGGIANVTTAGIPEARSRQIWGTRALFSDIAVAKPPIPPPIMTTRSRKASGSGSAGRGVPRIPLLPLLPTRGFILLGNDALDILHGLTFMTFTLVLHRKVTPLSPS